MAITFDNAEVAASSTLSNFTLGSGSNRIVVVGVGTEFATDITGVTFNSVSMTKIDEADPEGAGTVALFYILEADLPVAGDYTITATISGSPTNTFVGAISIAGAAQQAPEATNKATVDSGQTITCNITTLTNNAWVIDAVFSGDAGSYTANNQTERYDQEAGTSKLAGSTRAVPTAGLVTNSWTDSDSNPFRQGLICAAFAEASGSTARGLASNRGSASNRQLAIGRLAASGRLSV